MQRLLASAAWDEAGSREDAWNWAVGVLADAQAAPSTVPVWIGVRHARDVASAVQRQVGGSTVYFCSQHRAATSDADPTRHAPAPKSAP